MSVTDVPDPVKLVRSVYPGPKELPECRWDPLQCLAAFDLALIVRDRTVTRPVALEGWGCSIYGGCDDELQICKIVSILMSIVLYYAHTCMTMPTAMKQ